MIYDQIHWYLLREAYIWDINIWNFNISLTNDVISVEQPYPELLQALYTQICFDEIVWSGFNMFAIEQIL